MKISAIALSLSLLALTAPVASLIAVSPSFAAVTVTKLGDLSAFHSIVADTLMLANKGDLPSAQKRITDFETAWDTAAGKLTKLDAAHWKIIDKAADVAIKALRAKPAVASTVTFGLNNLLATLDNPDMPTKP